MKQELKDKITEIEIIGKITDADEVAEYRAMEIGDIHIREEVWKKIKKELMEIAEK